MSHLVHIQHAEEDVQGYLEKAAAIVGKVELDGDLKVPAFVKAIELLAGRHLVIEPQQPVLGVQHIPRQG